ncbi:MAG: hypothetical protein ACRDKB_02540 [Actinomycetota bacterium]
MADTSISTSHRSPTRREVLKKGAVGGALLWSAPAILTLSRAGAQQGTPCPGCTNSAFGLRLNTDTFGEGGCVQDVTAGGVGATVVCGNTGAPCSASASIATFSADIPGVITGSASAITSSAQAPCDCATGPTGSASVADLSVTVGGTTETASGSLPCNTVLIDELGVVVVLNEQTCDGDVLTVNAVHITGPSLDLILAQSRAGVAGCACTACA